MTLTSLDEAYAAEIENQVDVYFEQTILPANNLNTARWLLCVVGEDVHRFALMDATTFWHELGSRTQKAQFVNRLDSYRYKLRHALDLCAKKLPATSARVPVPIREDNYMQAIKLLKTAGEYADATRIFSSYHARSRKIQIDRATRMIYPIQNLREAQYGALEFLIGADRGDFSAIVLVVALFSGPRFNMPSINSLGQWSPTIHKVVKRAKLKNGQIRYQVVSESARELFDSFDVIDKYLDREWMFPWGCASHAQAYFAALQAICAYHLLSIHFGASKHGLPGIGVDQICLSIEAARLNEVIARISRLPMEIAGSITAALMLGADTNNPDPALQPLVPIGAGQLAVPGILILSSNWARNMLSLHARISPDSFNANSAIFEKHMIAGLEPELPSQFDTRYNIRIPTPNGSEEVDLLMIDNGSRSILIAELRWMLQPGDVREVLNRKKMVAEKVAQARRKVIRARESRMRVAKSLGLEPSSDWTINGLVIIEGFGGSPSEHPNEIPVVPKEVFVRLLNGAQDLNHAHAMLCSPHWLPQEGVDYDRIWEESTLCGVPFNRPGFLMGSSSYMNESLPQYLTNALALTAAELRSSQW